VTPATCRKCGALFSPADWQVKQRFFRCFGCQREKRNAYEARRREEKLNPVRTPTVSRAAVASVWDWSRT